MAVPVQKSAEYVLNHCAKYLARTNDDFRHSFFGIYDQQERGRISESWRFPIVDAHDGEEADASEWNDVTFVYRAQGDAAPRSVELVTTATNLYAPIPLGRVAASKYWSVTLKVPRGMRHRYKLVVDGAAMLDPINPQTETIATGEMWSSFFTWAYNQPINLERWEMALLDRLTRHILPFEGKEARSFIARGLNSGNVAHLFRLDIPAGVANYIDNILAREERHQLYAYKTCLDMLRNVLRRRNPGRDPAGLEVGDYVRLYDEMASFADPAHGAPALLADGWDRTRYQNPAYFLWLLRRHAWTGAFSHPKYGGNPGGMAWSFLSQAYQTTDDHPPQTAFSWRPALEPPLGTSEQYLG
jgi:hypothetical protein